MITLDDVRRIKAILIAHGEWSVSDSERAHIAEDGVFEWLTHSCSGETIAALIADGFDVYIWSSITYQGFFEIRIS